MRSCAAAACTAAAESSALLNEAGGSESSSPESFLSLRELRATPSAARSSDSGSDKQSTEDEVCVSSPGSNGSAGRSSPELVELDEGYSSGMDEAEEDDNMMESMQVGMLRRAAGNSSSGCTDRRGSYARANGRGLRKTHAHYAFDHWEKATSFSIGRPCGTSCPYGRQCGMDFAPRTLIACHQFSFGAATECTTTDDGATKYTCELGQSQTQAKWRRLVAGFVSWNAEDGTRVERFTVDRLGPVCWKYCAAAYGIPQYTMQSLLARARSGGLAQQEVEDTADDGGGGGGGGGSALRRQAIDLNTSHSKEECIEWWRLWLALEDQMPNEPVIKHRIVIWSSVYEEEYLPDIGWWGSARPLSLQRWTTLRKEALRLLSIEWFGSDLERDPSGNTPLTKLSLRERASHSKFPPCPECEAAKIKWADFRRQADRRYVSHTPRTRTHSVHMHVLSIMSPACVQQNAAERGACKEGGALKTRAGDEGRACVRHGAPSRGIGAKRVDFRVR